MIPRSFEDIAKSDVEALIANGVAERRTLEFKRELSGNKEKDRKEFLADVTSFANAQGGDILFGIDALKGIATAIAGLSIEDPDKEVLRWEEVLLAGVEPRLPCIRLRWIHCGEAGRVMLIRVPPSTIAPHRVIFAGSNRFFGCKSNGKIEMDTQELRDAFTASEALPTRLRALHLEAVDAALRGDLPIFLGDDPSAIVSLILTTIFREPRDLVVTPEHALAPHKPSGHMEAIRMIKGVRLHTNPREQGAVRSYAVTHYAVIRIMPSRTSAFGFSNRRLALMRHNRSRVMNIGTLDVSAYDGTAAIALDDRARTKVLKAGDICALCQRSQAARPVIGQGRAGAADRLVLAGEPGGGNGNDSASQDRATQSGKPTRRRFRWACPCSR